MHFRRLFAGCLAVLLPAAWQGFTVAADWPTYQHDAARSAVTPERLDPPLMRQWVFQSPHEPAYGWGDPEEGATYGVEALSKVRYDDCFQVAAVGDDVYFASSAENKVYAVDAARGEVRWTFFTDAPPRLAPTVSDGKVYFGADDGSVYCLRATDGKVVWRFQAAPSSQQVLGQGRMMSLWPVRTGVLVDGGIAYFAAGLFPSEGLSLYAVRADDGVLLWSNLDVDEGGSANLSPQGYLLASPSTLFMPSGRVPPALFDRVAGRRKTPDYSVNHHTLRIGNGGSYAMLTDDCLYYGTQFLMACNLTEGVDKYGRKTDGHWSHYWPLGHRIVVDGDAADRNAEDRRTAYFVTDTQMIAIPYRSLPDACRNEGEAFWQLYRDKAVGAYEYLSGEIARRNPGDPLREKLVSQMKNSDLLRKHEGYLPAAEKIYDSLLKNHGGKWRLACRAHDAMILAGGIIYAGGKDHLIAVDAALGKQIWTARVEGDARGLAVANGRLLVSTTSGNIYCFARPAAEVPPKTISPLMEGPPYPRDEMTDFYAQTARQIVERTGIDQGYCLILGGETGRLAAELARQTDLRIYVVEPDAGKVAAAREALSRAGLYGARVSVSQGSLRSLPYPPFFANLIVCEEAFLGGTPSTSAKELVRMLRPLGGAAVVGQPEMGRWLGRGLDPQVLQSWVAGLEGTGVESTVQGSCVWLERGPLPESKDWSHQYATAGNTAGSDDGYVKAPFGILWYGDPGPRNMIDRHAGAPAPLCVDGRMFILGNDVVMAYDAYNGLPLWQREIPDTAREGMSHESGSMAAAGDSLWLVAGKDQCLRLDAATGTTRQTYRLPARDDGQPRRWGWIAVDGGRLLGSRAESDRSYKSYPEPVYNTSESVFALDIDSGKLLWQHQGRGILHVSLAAGDGRVFLLDQQLTEAQRTEAIARRIREPGEEDRPALDARGEPIERDVRLAVGLDAASGRKLWQRPLDVTDCVVAPSGKGKGGELNLIYTRDVVLLCSAPWNGHFLPEFQAGKFSRRSIIALDAGSGNLLWSGHKGYRSRPLVAGETIYAEPWAYDLASGQPKMRAHPTTGLEEKWALWRGYGACGGMRASANCLITQADGVAYYDLLGDYGLLTFGGVKLSCSVNAILADGMVLIPGGAAQCACPILFQCSWGLYPKAGQAAYGRYDFQPPLVPVQRVALNLGAPGDRRDAQGTLWLQVPNRVHQWRWAAGKFFDDPRAGYYFNEAAGQTLQGTPSPWIYASGARGLREFSVPVVDKDAAKDSTPALYTVRLHFAEPDGLAAGRRVFHVAICGNEVLRDLDVAREAGGPHGAVVKQFRDIRIAENLVVELTPSDGTEVKLPVLCGVEIARQ